MRLSTTVMVVLSVSVASPGAYALSCPPVNNSSYSVGKDIEARGGELVKKQDIGIAQFVDQPPVVCEVSAGNPLDVERLTPWAGDSMMASECQGKKIRTSSFVWQIQDSNGTWHQMNKSGQVSYRATCTSVGENMIRLTYPNSWNQINIAGTDKTIVFGTGHRYF